MKLPWDKICIINLKKDKQRLKRTIEQLEREKLTGNKCAEGVYGYDFVPYGKKIKTEKNKKKKLHLLKSMRKKMEEQKLMKRTKYRALRIGEIGCNMSHYNTFKSALKNGYKQILVLEDDCKITTNFKEKLLESLKHVPKDYDILYLGISDLNYKWGKIKKVNSYIDKPLGTTGTSPNGIKYAEADGGIYGTHAFIINRKAMKQFIKYNIPMTYPTDVILGKIATRYNLIKAYSLKDHLIKTFNYGSNTMKQ